MSIFCKHYRAMAHHDTCNAGVRYDTWYGKPFSERPCFCDRGQQPPSGCDKAEFPTAEEIAARDAEVRKLFERTGVARAAIVAKLGPYKKGKSAGAQGVIDCPVCGGAETLQYSRSAYNGHIHAACKTDDCVKWME